MKHFISAHDSVNPHQLVQEALQVKQNPYNFPELGKNRTIGLLFFNSSLRTRLSTQKAAMNLGLQVMVMNIGSEGWALEYEDGTVMNGTSVEHVKDAAAVIGVYCDIIAIRCFPSLQDRTADYSEMVLQQFIKFSNKPIVSLESATLHPLQSLADLITIQEHKKTDKPKIVLTWAPHIKALPQVVANSFSQWVLKAGYDLTITHPEGFELSEEFTNGATVEYDQEKALQDADFVYVKNWSSYKDYGKVAVGHDDWMLTDEKMETTNGGKIMHCLPVRRNLEVSDELLDGDNALVLQQAENRIYAAQVVLKKILEANF
ncbi:acetylornithine carbamoyltransferase [Flavobacterium tegetincola]|uniref:acetylornithine carbamoyltransferase n=1 Tax=Flavobacterium tegetincola TaxID=150172 RepID=UPI000426C5DA|nr:acetylornithine carbamoyltransferase [Flavobacterium tegetincola]